MYDAIFMILALLFTKHWYIDFVDQSDDEVGSKGKYGEWLGIRHSVKQGIGTYIAFVAVITPEYWMLGLILAAIDAVVHYHVDWTKMNYGNRDITTPAFWNHLGLDQLAHYITYLFLVWIIV